MTAAAKPAAPHTPGRTVPYYACEHGIPGGCNWCRATVTTERDALRADAERLVACWNACEGMSDPAVEISALRSRSNGVPAMCAEVESLRAEVERLREALDRIATGLEVDGRTMDAMTKAGAAATARAALGGGK